MDMEIVETLVLVAHVLAALGIVGLVLLQQGRGADMGAGFGAGASSTVFGSGGAGNFLTKATTTIAIAFFLSSFTLAYFAKQKSVQARDLGIPQLIQPQEVPDEPAEVPTVENLGSEVPEL